jgi:hypothetical protein
MGNEEFSFHKTVASMLRPISIILIWKILPKEGTSAFRSNQTPRQDSFEKERTIFQISLSEKVLQGGRINLFDFSFNDSQAIQPFLQGPLLSFRIGISTGQIF